MNDTITTDPMTQIAVDLKQKTLELSRIEIDREDASLDGVGVEDLDQRVLILEKEKDALERKQRALERRATRATQEEKDAAKQRAAAIQFNIEQQIFELVQEMTRKIAALGDCGARLSAAMNAGRSLDSDLLRFQCHKLAVSLHPYLLHAVKQFPNCNTGLAPFIGLDKGRYADLFPAPVEKKK